MLLLIFAFVSVNMIVLVLVRICVSVHSYRYELIFVLVKVSLLVLTNIFTCCTDVNLNFCSSICMYNSTGRILRILEFCIPNSELQVPSSEVRFSDFRMHKFTEFPGLRFLDSRRSEFQISRFADF